MKQVDTLKDIIAIIKKLKADKASGINHVAFITPKEKKLFNAINDNYYYCKDLKNNCKTETFTKSVPVAISTEYANIYGMEYYEKSYCKGWYDLKHEYRHKRPTFKCSITRKYYDIDKTINAFELLLMDEMKTRARSIERNEYHIQELKLKLTKAEKEYNVLKREIEKGDNKCIQS